MHDNGWCCNNMKEIACAAGQLKIMTQVVPGGRLEETARSRNMKRSLRVSAIAAPSRARMALVRLWLPQVVCAFLIFLVTWQIVLF